MVQYNHESKTSSNLFESTNSTYLEQFIESLPLFLDCIVYYFTIHTYTGVELYLPCTKILQLHVYVFYRRRMWARKCLKKHFSVLHNIWPLALSSSWNFKSDRTHSLILHCTVVWTCISKQQKLLTQAAAQL